MINVRRVVNNKRLRQPILRIVQTETFDDYGNSVIDTRTTNEYVVVTTATQAELQRYVDGTTYKSAMAFTSSLIFNADNLAGQPDILVWNGDNYLVVAVDDYSENGYTRAIGALLDLQKSVNANTYSMGPEKI